MSNTPLHYEDENRKKIVADNLKKLRKQHKIGQDFLAHHFHQSRQTISSWENGKTTPSIEQLHEFGELYQVSLDYLFGYSQFTKPENEYIGTQTGLSDKSIEMLRYLNSSKEYYHDDLIAENLKTIKAINLILEDKYPQLEEIKASSPDYIDLSWDITTLLTFIYEFVASCDMRVELPYRIQEIIDEYNIDRMRKGKEEVVIDDSLKYISVDNGSGTITMTVGELYRRKAQDYLIRSMETLEKKYREEKKNGEY